MLDARGQVLSAGLLIDSEGNGAGLFGRRDGKLQYLDRARRKFLTGAIFLATGLYRTTGQSLMTGQDGKRQRLEVCRQDGTTGPVRRRFYSPVPRPAVTVVPVPSKDHTNPCLAFSFKFALGRYIRKIDTFVRSC